MTKKFKKTTLTTLKIAFSILLIYFVYKKIDIAEIGTTLKTAHYAYLGVALFFFVLSKTISALRVNRYFHRLGIPISHKSNFALALLGMFYNLFLPGGIGGDAYKGYVIQKKFQKGTKKVVGVLVLDRLSGLLLLFLFSCILLFFVEISLIQPYLWAVPVLMVLAVVVFWGLNKKFFEYVLPEFWPAFGYSAGVQAAQLVSVFCICLALGVEQQLWAYLLIFLVSSIVAVLPLTLGGIGSREVTFYYGAEWLLLQEGTAISISVLFFLITALVSLTGIYFHLNKPKLLLQDQFTA